MSKTKYELIIGPNLKVAKDKKSKSRVATIPFEFPDKTNGVIIMVRIKDEDWVPANTIKSIKITFNEEI